MSEYVINDLPKKRNNPCFHCEERTIGCHGSCVKYRKAKEEWDKQREVEMQMKAQYVLNKWSFDEYSFKSKKRPKYKG